VLLLLLPLLPLLLALAVGRIGRAGLSARRCLRVRPFNCAWDGGDRSGQTAIQSQSNERASGSVEGRQYDREDVNNKKKTKKKQQKKNKRDCSAQPRSVLKGNEARGCVKKVHDCCKM
jgi:hypothetical protein